MGLCRGHVGHIWLVWFIVLVCVNVGVNTNVHIYGCVNVIVHTDGVGPETMKAATAHESGVCPGIIQTTWDHAATLCTAVFTVWD